MSDETVKGIFVDLWKWWDRHKSNPDLDKAYEEGKDIVERYPNKLAMNMFVGLFRELEGRAENGQSANLYEL